MLRNEFKFLNVHKFMNTLGHLQNKGSSSLTLQETRSIHDYPYQDSFLQKRLHDSFISATTMYLVLLCYKLHLQGISLPCQQLNSVKLDKKYDPCFCTCINS